MVWIKRNLIFVVFASVGLILMLGAGWFLWSGISANSAAAEELKNNLAELQQIQTKVPYPSSANIQAIKDQQQQVKELLKEFRNSFAPFPPPPKVDERGFKSLLDKTILQLQLAATNAGIGVPDNYSFSFAAINSRLNFPAENIPAWAGQLMEIKAICDILFQAKIMDLEGIRRVPVCADDQGGADYLASASTTNETFITTPYEVQFHAFSPEVGAVLDGFVRATNCFLVKNVDISPATSTTGMAAGYGAPGGYPGAYGAYGRPVGGARTMRPDPVQQKPAVGRVGAGPSVPPVTVLSEHPLHVVMLIELIKPIAPVK